MDDTKKKYAETYAEKSMLKRDLVLCFPSLLSTVEFRMSCFLRVDISLSLEQDTDGRVPVQCAALTVLYTVATTMYKHPPSRNDKASFIHTQ